MSKRLLLGAWTSLVPPSLGATGAVLIMLRLSRHPVLGAAAPRGVCSTPVCGQLISSLLLAILSAFCTPLSVLLDVMGVDPLSSLNSAAGAEGGGFVVCFDLYLKSKHLVSSLWLWEQIAGGQQLCSLMLCVFGEERLISLACGGKPRFGVWGGGTET